MTPEDVIDYWFSERIRKHWFSSTPEIDREIRDRFKALWEDASAGVLDASWRNSPTGALALAIVLDQFPLNMFRGKAESFATERLAIDLSKWAVEQGFDRQLPKDRLAFLYMPLMHSEDLADQTLSVALFTQAGLASNAQFAKHHYAIVERFGRFPHRNEILGRESTVDELEYLNSKEAFKG